MLPNLAVGYTKAELFLPNNRARHFRLAADTDKGSSMGHALIVEDDADAARMMAALVTN